jgi:hypothetical protein
MTVVPTSSKMGRNGSRAHRWRDVRRPTVVLSPDDPPTQKGPIMTAQHDPYRQPRDDRPEPDELDQECWDSPNPEDQFSYRSASHQMAPRQRVSALSREGQRVSMARLFLACLACLPTGLYAVYLAGQVEPRRLAGDWPGADSAFARARTWSTASIVIGLVLMMLSLLSMCASAATY